MNLTDIHAHIIFGVDDGAKTIEEAIQMIALAQKQGVQNIVCTSHVTHKTTATQMALYENHFQALQEMCGTVHLYRGAEVFYTEEVLPMLQSGVLPTLAGTNAVLIEFFPLVFYETVLQALMELSTAGYIPVLAHAERYDCLRYPGRLAALHDTYGVKIQMNASTVLRTKTLLGDKWVRSALKHGLVDLVGSDTHNTKDRACNLEKAHAALCKLLSQEKADALCGGNAEKLLDLGK